MAFSILIVTIVGLLATRLFTHLVIVNFPWSTEIEYNPVIRYSMKKLGLWFTHITSSIICLFVFLILYLQHQIFWLVIFLGIAWLCAINDCRLYLKIRKDPERLRREKP